MERPSYYSILTASVRYDTKLSSSQKLLYSEITALSNKYGYCNATNGYFAKLYGVTTVSISNWITQLKNQGYLKIVPLHKKDGKVISRKIYPISTPLKKTLNPPSKKLYGGLKENFKQNNTSKNNTSKNIDDEGKIKNINVFLDVYQDFNGCKLTPQERADAINNYLIKFNKQEFQSIARKMSLIEADDPKGYLFKSLSNALKAKRGEHNAS